jgi:hypothetical protein
MDGGGADEEELASIGSGNGNQPINTGAERTAT